MKNLNFEKGNGLIPAIIQDYQTKEVLMLGFMNKESLDKTIKDGKVTFWSRTKNRLWQKGEGSGNYLKFVSVSNDCDNDSLLIQAKPIGPTCHTGKYSCFKGIKSIQGKENNIEFFEKLYSLIVDRKQKMPKKSYTSLLFKEGLNLIGKKVIEESVEVVFAAKKESRKRLIEEYSDLFYHLFVLMVEKGIDLKVISNQLEKMNKKTNQ